MHLAEKILKPLILPIWWNTFQCIKIKCETKLYFNITYLYMSSLEIRYFYNNILNYIDQTRSIFY